MEQIKTVVQSIRTKREEIASIKTELKRCDEYVTASNDSKDTLATLQQQRQDALSAAFLAGTKPDTTEVDKLIKAAEKSITATSDTIAGAVGARDVLQGQLDQAETELSGLIESAQRQVSVECKKRFEEAEKAFSKAVQEIGSELAKMIGVLKVTQRVGGYGDMRFALRDYVRGAGGLPERRNGRMQIPEWCNRLEDDLGNNEEAELLHEFEAAGFDFSCLAKGLQP